MPALIEWGPVFITAAALIFALGPIAASIDWFISSRKKARRRPVRERLRLP